VYIENCDVSGGWDNAIDFVAVQHGHVVGSRIHRAGDWAMYAKGGSAHLTIAGNEIFDAGTGGFTAGQGTGLEFMVAPYLTFEASDIRFVHNVVHDTQGAGFGVNGGSNILIDAGPLAADILANNAINTLRPVLVDPAGGDYRFAPSFSLPNPVPLPTLPGGNPPPVTPPPASVPSGIATFIVPAGRIYRPGEPLVFTAVMTEPVVVTGMPSIRIVIGSTMRLARFSGGSGTGTLTFTYTVTRKDRDADGTPCSIPSACRPEPESSRSAGPWWRPPSPRATRVASASSRRRESGPGGGDESSECREKPGLMPVPGCVARIAPVSIVLGIKRFRGLLENFS